MAKTKILVQDIADALNLSRTTVSKVLNNSGSVSPQTRERVLHKAAELNYKCYSLIQPVLTENLDLEEAFTAQSTDAPEEESAPSQQSQIAVFFSKGIDKQHIGFNLLSVLGQELSRKNYSISMYFIQEADFQSLLLPPTFHLEQTASIFCIELLDKSYSRMLCSLGKPILFFDAYAGILEDNLPADVPVYRKPVSPDRSYQKPDPKISSAENRFFRLLSSLSEFFRTLAWFPRCHSFLWSGV